MKLRPLSSRTSRWVSVQQIIDRRWPAAWIPLILGIPRLDTDGNPFWSLSSVERAEASRLFASARSIFDGHLARGRSSVSEHRDQVYALAIAKALYAGRELKALQKRAPAEGRRQRKAAAQAVVEGVS